MIGTVLMRKAIADVTRRKGRSLLMILGIFIGVFGLTSVNVASATLGDAFVFEAALGSFPDIALHASDVPRSFPASLQRMDNVEAFQVRDEFRTRWHMAGSDSVRMQINGYADFSHIAMSRFQIISGRAPGAGEIVMDVRDNDVHPVSIDDMVTVEKSDGSTMSLRVVGLTRTSTRDFQDFSIQALAYVSSDMVLKLSPLSGGSVLPAKGAPDFSTTIFVKAHDTNLVSQTADALKKALEDAHAQVFGVSIDRSDGGIDAQRTVDGLFNIIRLLAGVALLLSCLMIINMVTALLSEQVKIVGTMKALGGTRWRIILSYLVSVSIYAIIGTLLGIALGLPGGYQLAVILSDLMRVGIGPFIFSPWLLLVSVVTGLLVPLLGALIPLWGGTRITVREAISTYGVNAGRRVQVVGRGINWLPQTVWLGLRGLFRRPGRAGLTISSLAFACAIFVAVLITTTSIGATESNLIYTYHNDLAIMLDPDPVSTTHALELTRGVHGVASAEAMDEITVTSPKGPLHLVALTSTTHFYQPEIISGRWLQSSSIDEIVLSDWAAGRLGLHVNNFLSCKFGQKSVHWKIVGIVHDLNNASSSTSATSPVGIAFTSLENLNAFRQLPADYATQLLVTKQGSDHSYTAIRELERAIIPVLEGAGMTHLGGELPVEDAARQQQDLLIVYALFYSIAVIVALVGLLGLSNTLSASVIERRREIGILRSMGATGKRIGTVFRVESLSLALLSWFVGLSLGLPAGIAMLNMLSNAVHPFDLSIQPLLVLISLGFVLVVALLATFGPVLNATRVRIQDILRYE